MENELEKALESKFFCPTRFAQEIESLVLTNEDMNYIDAIVYFCEQNSIDVESIPKLISKPLKEKIKYEAMELNFLIESKFFCPTRFAQEIESLVLTNEDMNYIDAIVYFCEQNSIDVESIPKLISKPLKEKIKYEAMELNFLKKTSRAKLVF